MSRFMLIWCLFLASVPAFSQTSSPKYQPGTITAVERHATTASSDPVQYDVTVRIEDTEYVILYTPPNGSNTVEFAVGVDRLFAVATNALLLSVHDEQKELPILRTKQLPPQPAIDWSKAPGQYFSMKMKNLTDSLHLSDEQQAKIKPIAEQETAEAGHVIFTPVVPRKERLEQWEKIVQKSDTQMKPILTAAQWQKLQEIRKDQKRELTEIVAKQDSDERK